MRRLIAARSIREASELDPRFVYSLHDFGHVPQLEVPERVVTEIERFLVQHPMPAPAAA